MHGRFLSRIIFFVFSILVLSGAVPAPAARQVVAFVSIAPQAYLVERIGGDRVAVHMLVGPGREPHDYEPTPRQLTQLSRARLYFRIGLPFETVLVRKITAGFRDLTVVDTRRGVPLRYFSEETHAGRYESRAHGAETADPHIWMSPRLMKIQAETIARALSRTDPQGAAIYNGNLQALLNDLDRVDRALAKQLAPFRGGRFYVFHPAFGYFGDAYGLTQVPVEISGKEPSARQLANLIRSARKDGVRMIFVQPQFARKKAAVIARQIGGVCVPIDSLAGDYLNNMERIGAALLQGLVR